MSRYAIFEIILISFYLISAEALPVPTVAVVGAGPYGLVAALELQNKGYNVTVFEKSTTVVPLIQSLQLNGYVYEYLSQLLLPSATISSGLGSPPAVAAFASKYQQPVDPLPASLDTLSFDNVAGVNPVPPFWLPYLSSQEGQNALVQQLAAGVALLARLDTVQPTPDGFIGLGLVTPNQIFAEWAEQLNLPAFTQLIENTFDSALSGPTATAPAASVLALARISIPGELRAAFLGQGITANSSVANAAGISSLLQGAPIPASFFHFPKGARTLFETAVSAQNLTVRLETPVLSVSNTGLVTFLGGKQQFDNVIVTVRPEAASLILSPPLSDVYIRGHTGLKDLWIFNATVSQPATAIGSKLLQPFIATVTENGVRPPANGTPTYILRLDAAAPVICAGAYVLPNVSSAASTATAISTMAKYGFNVTSTIQYSRVQYASFLPARARVDRFSNIFLLGEGLEGIGVSNAIVSVPSKIAQWFP